MFSKFISSYSLFQTPGFKKIELKPPPIPKHMASESSHPVFRFKTQCKSEDAKQLNTSDDATFSQKNLVAKMKKQVDEVKDRKKLTEKTMMDHDILRFNPQVSSEPSSPAGSPACGSPAQDQPDQGGATRALKQTKLAELNKVLVPKQELAGKMVENDKTMAAMRKKYEDTLKSMETEIARLKKDDLGQQQRVEGNGKISEQRRKRIQVLEGNIASLDKQQQEQQRLLKLNSQNEAKISPNLPAARPELVKLGVKRNADRGVRNVAPRPVPDILEESMFDDSDEDPNFVPSEEKSFSSSSDSSSGLNKISIMKALQRMKPKTDLNKNVNGRKCARSNNDRKIKKIDEVDGASPAKKIKIAETTFRSKPFVTTKTVIEKGDENCVNSEGGFKVLRCSRCLTFQSLLLARKALTWKCMTCLEQQTINQVYYKGSMKACCKMVEKMSSEGREKSPNNVNVQERVSKEHGAVDLSNPGLKCGKCSRDYKNLKSCIKHEKKCGLTAVVCNKCQVNFKTIRYLKRHIRDLHKEPEYMCDCEGCDMRFSTKFKLKIHIKNHNASCDQCGKTFKNTNSLKTHRMKSHTNKTRSRKKSWICSVCPHEVKSERGLRYHMQLHKEWGEEADDIEEVKESDEVMEARPEHSEEIGNVDIDQSEGVVTDTEQCDLAQENSSIYFFDEEANVFIEVDQSNILQDVLIV